MPANKYFYEVVPENPEDTFYIASPLPLKEESASKLFGIPCKIKSITKEEYEENTDPDEEE